MAYEKHTWETGEVITAEKLNHIEDGFGLSSVPILDFTVTHGPSDTYTSALTYSELTSALTKFGNIGAPCFVRIQNGSTPLMYYGRATRFGGTTSDWSIDYFSLYPALGINETGIKIDLGRLTVSAQDVVTDYAHVRTVHVSTS